MVSCLADGGFFFTLACCQPNVLINCFHKGTKALQMAAFGGLFRGQDAGHGPSYFTTMDKKGPECISACQVVMDPGPVYIICGAYLDNTEKVLLGLSDTKPNLVSTC